MSGTSIGIDEDQFGKLTPRTTDGKFNCRQDRINRIDTPFSEFWGPGVKMKGGRIINGSRTRCNSTGERTGYCRERGPNRDLAFNYDCSNTREHGDTCTITNEDGYKGGEVMCKDGMFTMTKEPERISSNCDPDRLIIYVTGEGSSLNSYLKSLTWDCTNATNHGDECIITPSNPDVYFPGQITCTNGFYTITPGGRL